MTDKFKNLTVKLKKLCDSIRNKPVLLCGIGCFVLFCLAFFTIYYVRVMFEPKWVTQIKGTLVLFGIMAGIAAAALVAAKFSKGNKALLMTALLFIVGMVFVFVTPPNQAPDEQSHFLRSYAMGMGDFQFDEGQQWPNDVYLLMDAFPIAYNNGYPARDNYTVANRFDMYYNSIESGDRGTPIGIIIFQIIPYLPQALGVFIGRMFGAHALICMWLARIVNLMFYCGCCFVALSWAKKYRMMMYAVMAMPLTLFIAASCNNDSMLFGLMFLCIGSVLNDKFDRKKAITFAIAFAVMCTSKMSYIVFALLLILMDNSKWKLKRKKWQYFVIVFITFFVVYQGMGYAVALLSNYGVIERTMIDSNPMAQLMFIIKNPLRYVVVFLDTLRNNSFFLFSGGLLGWIDVDIRIVSYFTPVMLLWAAFKNAQLLDKKDLKPALVFLAICILTYGVTLTGMYITWTPVTLPQIIGMQMRYILPGLFGLLFGIAYWMRGYMAPARLDGKGNPAGENSLIWTNFVFGLVSAALYYAVYYIPEKSIVFVS